MSKLSRIVFSIILVFAVVTACEAPAGSEGSQGPEGPQGPVGPAGEDGSVMYAGPDSPTADIGDTGDYYLNTTTGEYYGPKDSDGWGNPIIVLMGEDGADGSVIHSGDGPPSSDLGKLGDYYFDQKNGDFYGPKTESGWGSPTSLTGDEGPAGENGSVIHAGDTAPTSDTGTVGDYYLNKSTGEFYGPKTENGWGTPINLTGADGQDGADGEDGSQIYSGNGAPDSSIGVIGDYYLDKSNYDLYGPKVRLNKVNNGGWGTPLNLKGADGNANVTRYIFPGHDFSADSNVSVTISGVNNPTESAWLVYVKKYLLDIGTVFDLPGYGTQAQTYYRTYRIVSDINISVVDGPGEYYEVIEIVRIEASSTEDMSKQKGLLIPDELDSSDYEAVAEYYDFYQ